MDYINTCYGIYWLLHKKDNIISLIILCLILLFLGYHIYTFFGEVISFFPNHLLSLLFCLITMYLYVFLIFKNKRIKNIGLIISSLIIILSISAYFIINNNIQKVYETTIICNSEEIIINENTNVYLEDNNYGNVFIFEEDFSDSTDYCIKGQFIKQGKTKLIVKNNNDEKTYNLIIERNSYKLK